MCRPADCGKAVTLETVPLRYVAWVHVTPHNSGDVTVEARLAGSAGSHSA